MKKSLIVSILIPLSLVLLLILVCGCTKRSIVRDYPPSKEKTTMAKESGAEGFKEEGMAARGSAVREEPLTEGSARSATELTKEQAGAGKAAGIFEDIHFDYDKYILKPEAREILKKGAAWLAKNKNYNVVIEGNCDERGTVEYNLALGERRAAEAMKYFVELGIDKKRIKTISYGKERPLDPGHDEEAWAKNRRDHFITTPKK
ncbi:MAG TPA: peptidoglycan-associated lipoprotein Pal [Syntrophales bacterium]|nr:peptidoglycan-associated lipoprotein Pal [Syntrophales bacterium]